MVDVEAPPPILAEAGRALSPHDASRALGDHPRPEGLFPTPGPGEEFPPPPPDEDSGSLPTEPTGPANQRDYVLWLCRLINSATITAALLCAVAFALALAMRVDFPMKTLNQHAAQAVRAYGIGACLLIVAVETESRWLAGLWPILDMWIGRSVYYSFVAVLTLRETYFSGETEFHRTLGLYRIIASAGLFVCAAVYLVGFATFLGTIKGARINRLQEREDLEAEYAQLESRREQLHRLLD